MNVRFRWLGMQSVAACAVNPIQGSQRQRLQMTSVRVGGGGRCPGRVPCGRGGPGAYGIRLALAPVRSKSRGVDGGEQ
jgi:hypothetical protein